MVGACWLLCLLVLVGFDVCDCIWFDADVCHWLPDFRWWFVRLAIDGGWIYWFDVVSNALDFYCLIVLIGWVSYDTFCLCVW